MSIKSLALVALLSLTLFSGSPVEAGEPCICWPIEVGEASVIDVEHRGASANEVASKLVASLTNELPVLARMENLRRAALALQGKPAHADYVLARLLARVLDAETGKAQERAKLWFDAGYAVACFRQAGQVHDLRGYRWIARAIQLSGGDGAMHYGAALAVLMPHPDHDQFEVHVNAMRKAVESDPLLGKNLKFFQKQYPQVLKYFANKK